MMKGIFLALALLLVGDLTLNGGQGTRAVQARFVHFVGASSDAISHSVFRGA